MAATEHARNVAGYIHPKLQTTMNVDVGANQRTIVHELMHDVDERIRSIPLQIEHKPQKVG